MADASPSESVELQSEGSGLLLPVQAQAGARRNAVVGLHAGRVKVAVTQAPEKGKANQELARVLAASLGLKKSQVKLHSGRTSSKKLFLITETSLVDLRRWLDTLPAT